MILAVDIGNSNICIGLYDESGLRFTVRARTDPMRTEDEYAIFLDSAFRLRHCRPELITGAAVSSVVPALTRVFVDAVALLAPARTVIVGPGVKTGINIRIDDPSSLGADLLCTAVGAAERFPLPAIIADLGTATKISVVTKNRDYIGGAILPGVQISLGALAGSTSLLPSIGLSGGEIRPVGSNTVDCMLSGAVLGTAGALDALVGQYRAELDTPPSVLACGGLAPSIIPHCKTGFRQVPSLLLDGLLAIYRKNV